jgi:hypothetical protein
VLFAYCEPAVASFDQWRTAEDQAALGAGEAKIVVAVVFTETPDLVHAVPLSVTT